MRVYADLRSARERLPPLVCGRWVRLGAWVGAVVAQIPLFEAVALERRLSDPGEHTGATGAEIIARARQALSRR